MSYGQALIGVTEELANMEDALASEDRPAWRKAWESELASLEKNGTWVVERAPENRNIVGC